MPYPTKALAATNRIKGNAQQPRAFEFMEVGGVFEQRYGEEQHNQRIADCRSSHCAGFALRPIPRRQQKFGGWLSPAPKALLIFRSVEKALFRFSTIQFLVQGFTFFRIKK